MIELPEEVQDGLFRAIVKFKFKYPDVEHNDIVVLMMDVIMFYDDYIKLEVGKQEMK